MHFDFTIEQKDLESFYWQQVKSSSIWRSFDRYLYGAVFAIFTVLTALNADSLRHFLMGMIWVTFFFILWKVFGSVLQRIAQKRAIRQLVDREKEGRGIIGRHSIALDDEGVVEQTAVTRTVTRFEGVDRLEETDEHLYIYISASQAHIIPKRAFGSKDKRDEFWRVLKERVHGFAQRA